MQQKESEISSDMSSLSVTYTLYVITLVESVRSEDDEESEESEDDDVFVPKEFVEIREGDVQTFYCIEEEVGRYVSFTANKLISF